MIHSELAHPDPQRLRAFGLGYLDESEATSICEHLEHCPRCRELVEAVPDDPLASLVRSARGEGRWSLADPSHPLADHPRYKVVELVGAGGMGAVYRAEHQVMQRTVALKVINPHLLNRAGVVERFRREVTAAAALAHPNIVTAYDAEQVGDTHFLVMEYVPGVTLDRLVHDQGPLPIRQASDYARQAALGLQHAFQSGMVHRDIKPHNLMLAPSGQVKILDFGLARFAREVHPHPLSEARAEAETLFEESFRPIRAECEVTIDGFLLGTADYIAPEQAEDPGAADIRADIYSLGCTLYFLLTGQAPFSGGTVMEKLRAHRSHAAPPLSCLRPDVPPALIRIVEQMMAKNPDWRFQTPGDVVLALAEVAGADGQGPGRFAFTGSPTASPPSRPGRRRVFLVALAVILASAGLAAYFLGPDLLRYAAGKGLVEIQTDGAALQLGVWQDGKVLETVEVKTRRNLELSAGQYELIGMGGGNGAVVRAGGVRVTAGGRSRVHVEQLPDFVGEVGRLVDHAEPVHAVAISTDGRFALSGGGGRFDGHWRPGSDNAVRLWDLGSGQVLRRFEGSAAWIIHVAFAPNGKHVVACGGDGIIRLWDASSGKQTLALSHDQVMGVALSPDGGHLVSAGWDRSLRVWDLGRGTEIRRLGKELPPLDAVALSPNGSWVAAAGENALLLFDGKTGEPLRRFNGTAGRISRLVFSGDGRWLLSAGSEGSERSLRLWDVLTGRERQRFIGHTDNVSGAAFAPDERRVLSTGYDGTLRLWDTESGRELVRFGNDQFGNDRGPLLGVAAATAGRHALTCGVAPALRWWRLPDPEAFLLPKGGPAASEK